MTKRTTKSGYKAEIKIYECETCEGCEHKILCTKSKYNRRIYVSEKFINYRQESNKNITSETGKKNVKTEFMLLCFGI